MSLLKCKECGNEVAKSAESCPKCGAKKPKSSGCLVIILGFIILASIINILGKPSKNKAQEEVIFANLTPKGLAVEEKIRKANEKKAIEKNLKRDISRFCRDIVVASLHDPESSNMNDYDQYYFEKLKNNEYFSQVTGSAKNGFNATRKIIVNCKVRAQTGQNIKLINLKQIQE